ncbi:hypothetical protein RRG08_012659 [Elysia crispata]|uniref:Uncharacterized protein n=1 Tax=Elysia crispata TaxID=231223 RepID=A0AAE0YMM3_9GAST|nr:hypothetical protein RRG08_012659 [Elysia crispata]
MTIIMLAVYRGYHGYVQIDSAMDGRTRSECSNGVERKEIVAIAIVQQTLVRFSVDPLEGLGGVLGMKYFLLVELSGIVEKFLPLHSLKCRLNAALVGAGI